MVASNVTRPPEFPDDPKKWDGWSKYRADNLYERLCLDARVNPTDEQIQQHCSALLQWWQKKLPLKNQPTNPLAQLLGRGIDDASRYLVEARMQLLDPARRREIDQDLAARANQAALAEFAKYVSFSIAGGVLTAEAEANLIEFGQRNGLSDEQTRACIEEELKRNSARRAERGPASDEAAPPAKASAELEKEFMRIVQMGEVTMSNATDEVREILLNVGHNLGIGYERSEWLLDEYLEEEELAAAQRVLASRPAASPARSVNATPVRAAAPPAPASVPTKAFSGPLPPSFVNAVSSVMVLVPSGEFVMGSDAIDAGPNEQPLTPVKLSDFYMSRHPVTNGQYEQFDRGHRTKRMKGTGDHHPVVHVTSLDAVRFCDWLSQKEGKKYRLPTEAEWEYAARGKDGRKYPWGNHEARSDLANFADATTNFPWRDVSLSDGYPESSPVGAFPRGASFFGIEDMAGNVWEWCLDFLQPYAGSPKTNPRAIAGPKRVHRGGSWKSRFSNLRATARASNAPAYSCNDVGFRIVCETGQS